MKTWFFSILIAFISVNALAAQTPTPTPAPAATLVPLVSFNAAVGVTPFVNSGMASSPMVAANIVRGVNPPGAPWRIGSLFAAVYTDGTITVFGTRLLLAGGNGIGSNPVPMVQAKLFCGTGNTAFSSLAAPLDANGNFSISGKLSSKPPDPCSTPALLIVAATPNGPWLAAGIPDNVSE